MKRGRPTKYSEEMAEDICTYLALGVTAKMVCEHTGISEFTFYDWIKQNPDFAYRVRRANIRSIAAVQAAAARLTVKIIKQHKAADLEN